MAPVPVTVLAGFLGAGKTTLLNHILHANHGVRIAALISDFGAIKRDAQLTSGAGDAAGVPANGSTCQIVHGDLLQAALDALARPEAPEYVLIETSGVTDPTALAALLRFSDISALIRLDSVITVVDAAHAADTRYAALLRDQLFAADLVVLNKIDLVDEAERKRLKRWISGIVPRARIIETSYGHAPFNLLLNVDRFRMTLDLTTPSGACDVRPHQYDELFGSWNFASDQPFKLGWLQHTLLDLPPGIFRAKGIVMLAESPDRRTLLQLVGSQITLTPGETWNHQSPRTQLMVTGTLNGIDPIDLTRRFEACLTCDIAPPSFEIAWTGIREDWLKRI